MRQSVKLEIEERAAIRVREQLKGQVKDPALPRKKRVRREFQVGFDERRSRGDFVYKERDIDKDGDRYRELVCDEDTGEVLHHVEEALSAHRGHGSAKAKSEVANDAAPSGSGDDSGATTKSG